MIISRVPSLSMKGFARAASRNKSRGPSRIFIQRGLPSGTTNITTDDGTQRRTLSTYKISALRHRFLAVDNSDAISSLSTQRRLRSALPNEYYDDDKDQVDVSLNDTTRASKPFLLADIGEGIAEVELLRWFVEEGQVISEFDPVCEVQSDKATVEITSRFDGRVQKLAYSSTGNMIKVGEPILWILTQDSEGQNEQDQQQNCINANEEEVSVNATATTTESSSLSAREVNSSTLQPADASSMTQEPGLISETKRQPYSRDVKDVQNSGHDSFPVVSNKVLTSPAVRKLARDHELDLSTIDGTGPSGRILKGDVLAFLQESDSPMEAQDCTTYNTVAEEVNCPHLQEDKVVPMRGYNRIMANTMAASLKIPHMVYSDEINLNRFVKYKMEQQQLNHRNNLNKLLFLPLAIKAASKALEKYPWLNASFDENKHEAILWKDHNIGIAMDTSRGLIVPVIRQCQEKSLPELAEELRRLKSCVVEGVGRLPASDLKGATFTLSNVGAIGGGGTYMSPIITPPQVAIGALGQIRRLPRFVTPSSTDPAQSQTIEEAHICAVSWAADHRVVDGATVARFHKSFKEYMEDPIKLLLELR